MYGNLPSESQLADWEFAVSQHSAVPQGILVRFSFSSQHSADDDAISMVNFFIVNLSLFISDTPVSFVL